MSEKAGTITFVEAETYGAENSLPQEKAGTFQDQQDMHRLGKQQELRRNFRFISTMGFSAVLMCTWEAVFITSSWGLINGGLAGSVWIYLIGVLGFGAVVLSMAEMASMAPTSGGQYHWVSEFSPPRAQKLLSFITGWLGLLGYVVGAAVGGYVPASIVQGLTVLFASDYVYQRWHGTLIIFAVAIFSVLFNTFLARKLPKIEIAMLVCHVVGFFAILIPLWVCGPHNSAADVFTKFTNSGGWPSTGLSCLVGLTAPVFSLIGPDSTVHMAEEVKNASWVLPRSMLCSILLNGSTGLIMIITYCFCITDLEGVLESEAGFPFMQVFYNSTRSEAGTVFMSCILMFMSICSAIDNVAAGSRQLYSFARDGGLPFANVISQVRPGWDIPLNAIFLDCVLMCLLGLVNIGSSVAFNAIGSLGVGTLMTTYMISVGSVFIRRWWGAPLPPKRWSMGVAAPFVNLIALIFMAVTYIFSFFPLAVPITLETMNWSCLIYGAVIIFALVYYVIQGRHVYKGPVVLIKRDL